MQAIADFPQEDGAQLGINTPQPHIKRAIPRALHLAGIGQAERMRERDSEELHALPEDHRKGNDCGNRSGCARQVVEVRARQLPKDQAAECCVRIQLLGAGVITF